MPTPETAPPNTTNMQHYADLTANMDALASRGLALEDAGMVSYVTHVARSTEAVISAGLVHTQELHPRQDSESFRSFATAHFTAQAIHGVLGNPDVREQIYQVERAQRSFIGRTLARFGINRVTRLGMHNG